MKKFAIGMLALAMTACASAPVVENLVSQNKESKGLYAVSNTSFDKFYVKSSDVVSQYSAVKFEPLDLENLVIDNSHLDSAESELKISENEKTMIKGYFAQRAERVFTDGERMILADESGQGVLIAEFEFVEFAPKTSKSDSGETLTPDVFSKNVGELTVKATLVDSLSGNVVAVIQDKDAVGGKTERNDRISNIRYLNLTMEKWLRQMKNTLVAIRS